MAGAALALTLPKPGLCFLAWAAPAVLFAAILRARKAAAAARSGAAFSLAFFGVALHWIYLTCRFAGVVIPVAILAWAALCLVLSLSWALYAAVAHRLCERLHPAVLPWALAAVWAALESALARWTPRLGVDLLAYTQWRHLSLLQASSIFGPHGLGFLIMLWNASLAVFWERSRPAGRASALAAAGLIAVWGAYGGALLAATIPSGPSACVEILQPNIDQYRKWDERYESEIRGVFDELLSKPRERKADLIVWPESALPGWLGDPALMRWLTGWSRKLQAPMLVGAISADKSGNHNSAALLGPSGNVETVYHKRQLVPFGEFVPLRSLLEGWIGILAQMSDLTPGPSRQQLMDAGFGPFAASICYETMFPRWVCSDAGRGAVMMVNLTNDGWYKDTWAPYQHFYANVFRAVENRVFVFRAANTGISGVIRPDGRVIARTQLNRRDRLSRCMELEFNTFTLGGSFYARHGDWFGTLCLLLSLPLVLWKTFF